MKRGRVMSGMLHLFVPIAAVCACGSEEPGGPSPVASGIEIQLSRDTLTWVGDTVHLSATVELTDGSQGPISPEWSSTTPTVIGVDGSGVVTARANGQGRVGATSGDLRADTMVVVDRRAAAIQVRGPDSVLAVVGLGTRLEVQALDEGGTALTSLAGLAWSSSDPDVASVDDEGRVTAVSNGTTRIVASLDGTSGDWPIRVAQLVPAEEVSGPVAFVNVTVLPMNGTGPVVDQTVVTDGATIVQVGPSTSVAPPPGAHVVDGAGRFLMPGLADMHTHVATETSVDAAPGQLLLYTAHGVTTILGQGDFGEPLPQWARDVESGSLLGPTIYTARYARGIQDGSPASVQVTGAAQARAYADEAASLGYDFLKVYNYTGEQTFAALVDEGLALGLPVIGHIPQPVGFEAAIAGGMVLVSHAGHGGFLTSVFGNAVRPDLVDRAIDQTLAAGAWVNPTLAVEEAITRVWGGNAGAEQAVFDQEGVRYLHPATLQLWSRKIYQQRLYNPAGSVPGQLDAAFAFVEQFTRQFFEAGIPIIAGSDSPTVLLVPGLSMLHELYLMEDIGIPRASVLRIATRNAGEFISQHLSGAEPFGTVEVGQRADLILLEANPLDDLGNLQRRLGVMTRGTWRTEPWLRLRLEALAEAYGR
jgi:imidazolonepropionase-like amidohydrolase